MRLPLISSNASTVEKSRVGVICGDMCDLNKEGRAKRSLDDLRPVLEEILAVRMAEKYVDIKIDAARGLEGLNHAEEALRKFESGAWNATEPTHPEVGSERENCSSDGGLEDALVELRASASEELHEATLGEVLAAADPSDSRSETSAGEGFATAVGAVVIGEESLPEAAERRGVEAAAVAEALARYRLPEAWEGDRWADVEDVDGTSYRTERREMDDG